jgi:NADPH:quinone reductase-like Zn-dependent oxidoreductase
LDNLGGKNIVSSFPLIKKGGSLITLPTAVSPELTTKAHLQDIQAYYIQVHSDADDLLQIADLLKKGTIKSFVTRQNSFDELPKALEPIKDLVPFLTRHITSDIAMFGS